MPDRPEIQRSFEAPPTSVRTRRRDPVPVLVAIALVAFIALAVAKPWGTDSPVPGVVTAVATRTPEMSMAPGPASATTVDPAYGVSLAARTPAVDGRAPGPVELARDPVTAATPLVEAIAMHVGAWGIGAAGWDVGSAGPVEWTLWRPTAPMRRDDAAFLLGYLDRERLCAPDRRVKGGADVLAVTSPPGIRPDWVVTGWVVARDGTTVIAPKVKRITLSSSDGSVSALAFADGSSWADGIYRLVVRGGGDRLAVDVCLGSGGPLPGQEATRPPTVGVIQTIAGGLVGRSGEWGIGTGGPDGGAGGAWVGWRAATPVSEDRSIGIRPPPSCRAVLGGAPHIRPGLVLAVTVPAGLVPDWKVEAARFDERGRSVVDAPARQVAPPGNRGIAYLVRSDGSAWPAGAYRLRVTTSTASLSLDVCLAGP